MIQLRFIISKQLPSIEGHANVFGDQPITSWVEELEGNLAYMHWNDNHGDIDSELSIGDGKIDWNDFIALVLAMKEQPRIVLEVGSIENIKKSLRFLSKLQVLEFDIE